MNLLLDAHVLLWWLADDPQLSEAARSLIADPENTVFLSAVVMWEIRIKQAIGKLDVPEDFGETVAKEGFTELPVTIGHVDGIVGLPMHHRDPFDRLLIAQAIAEDLVLLSFDPEIAKYDLASPSG